MERFNVCLYVETTLRGPGKRDGSAEWLVEFVSAKGDTVTRQGLFCMENTTETQITLRAIVEALKILKKPCVIRIFTDCTHIINVVSNRWHIWWKKAGWVNAKGRQVKNADLWEEFMQEMEAHVYTIESGHHSFKNIMQSDLEKPAILLVAEGKTGEAEGKQNTQSMENQGKEDVQGAENGLNTRCVGFLKHTGNRPSSGNKRSECKRFVYVCSWYGTRGDRVTNLERAREYCRSIIDEGAVPICPHLFYGQVLKDEEPAQREAGLKMGLELLKKCNELRVFTTLSDGMKAEVSAADQWGIPVTVGDLSHLPAGEQAESASEEIAQSIDEWRGYVKEHHTEAHREV